MKRLTALLLVALMVLSFAGCGKEKEYKLYKDLKFNDYVTLTDYNGIKVDTKSDDYKETYESVKASDIEDNDLYVRVTEGTVKEGDTANIDYVGKKDGVAFDGGTANGYDLEIGSGSFIDGFEEGLVGAEIGSTVDLNLTFPEDYGNEELNGQAVVFTVKVNYVKTDTPKEAEEYYSELGFKSVKEYNDDLKERAVKDYLLSKVIDKSKVKKYPKTELKEFTDLAVKQYDDMCQAQMGVNLETYLQYTGSTLDAYKSQLETDYVKPMMDSQLVLYAILDKEDIEFSQKETDKKINEMLEQYGGSVTKEQAVEYFGEYYFENMAISEKVADYLYDNAKIK